jgi:hypothetical protein
MSSSAERWSLTQLQDWLRTVTTEPTGMREGLLRARQRFGEGLPVCVPEGVLLGDRLAIYARGYLDRLLSCLRADFPALRALLGEEIFDAFAIAYLRAQPPRHYSMFELGRDFADHLARTCPAADALTSEQRGLLQLPVDLARIERARLEVTRAKGKEGEREARLELAGSWQLSDQGVIESPACLRVLELAHDVRPFLHEVDHGRMPTRPVPKQTTLAVSRVDYRVVFTELTEWQRHVIRRCSEAPHPAFALAREAAEELGQDAGAVLAELLIWLPSATANGLCYLPQSPLSSPRQASASASISDMSISAAQSDENSPSHSVP